MIFIINNVETFRFTVAREVLLEVGVFWLGWCVIRWRFFLYHLLTHAIQAGIFNELFVHCFIFPGFGPRWYVFDIN